MPGHFTTGVANHRDSVQDPLKVGSGFRTHQDLVGETMRKRLSTAPTRSEPLTPLRPSPRGVGLLTV